MMVDYLAFCGGLLLEMTIKRSPRIILKARIKCFQYDPESIAWSQPYLALVYYKLGDREKAKRLIIESLSTTIDMQA
jgi:hypothetical protein